jgi:hypothetical protein
MNIIPQSQKRGLDEPMNAWPGFALAFALLSLTWIGSALAQPNMLEGWTTVTLGDAQVDLGLETVSPPVSLSGTNALRLNVGRLGERAGIVCANLANTDLVAGQCYDLSFFARTGSRKTFALTISLETLEGKVVCARTTLPEVGGSNWTPYHVALNVHKSASRNRLLITLAETGTIWMTDISLKLRGDTAAQPGDPK